MSTFCKIQDKSKKKMAASLVSSLKRLETEEARLRSLKRSFDYRTEECPSSKKLITEEVMVGYLEQLNLVTRENSQTESMDKHLLPPQTLSVRKIASCRDTVELGTRKRHLECDLPEEEMDIVDADDLQINQSRFKRLRVDMAENVPDSDRVATSNARTGHYHHADSQTMVPSHSIGGKSDLSSIPEGYETSHKLPEGASCDLKLKNDNLPISVEDRTRCESHIHFPLPTPPPSVVDHQSSLPATDIKPHLWVAPELQRFCTSKEPLLPSSIVKEIRSQGMALVPYVGSPMLALWATKGDNMDGEDSKDNPLSPRIHNSTYLSDR